MLSVIGSAFADFLRWCGWVIYDFTLYTTDGTHFGAFAPLFAIGIAASLLLVRT